AEAEVTDKISEDVREGLEKSQREFLLRQQLAAIRKELGEGEPEGSDDYRARVEAAEVPEAVREALLREVDKLERSSDQSPETAWIRTWLDTVLELPWNVTTEDSTDVGAARAALDGDLAPPAGRRFVRVARGAVRDEAEIRGHRRTYVGALPGRIVRAIKEAGSMTPVVLLDEVDQVGSGSRG